MFRKMCNMFYINGNIIAAIQKRFRWFLKRLIPANWDEKKYTADKNSQYAEKVTTNNVKEWYRKKKIKRKHWKQTYKDENLNWPNENCAKIEKIIVIDTLGMKE